MKYSESKSFLAINRHISKKALPDRNDPAGLDSFLGLDLHPAGQGEGDPVLGVDRHSVYQRGPLACIEFGVELRQDLDGFDEPLQLPAPDHDLVDPVRHLITPAFGFFVPADQCVVALVVLGLVLGHPCILGNQVVDRFGVDAQLLVQNPSLLLQRRCRPAGP